MNRVFRLFVALLITSCGGGSTKPATDPGPGTDEAAEDSTFEDPGPLADISYPDFGLDLGCVSECVLGTKECAGAGWRTCTDLDGDGCAEWSLVTDCPLGTACKDGVCSAACPNAPCTVAGARKCEGDSWVKCEDTDGDGCLEWGPPTACDPGLVCSNGFCATSCKDACTVSGSTKCEGNAVVTCKDANEDGCLEWADPNDCKDLLCANGYCKTQCESMCTVSGAHKCDGPGVTTCGDYNGDGCLEWGTTVPCGPDQTCSNGFCTAVCKNECTAIGAKKCVGNAVASCADANADGCLEWGTPLPCAEDLVCANGHCESVCKNECTVGGTRKCDGNGYAICGDYNGKGCLEWGTTVPCAEDQICSNGFCQTSCKSECTVVGAKKCVGNAVSTCGDYAGNGCLTWGTPLACDQGLTCTNGNCASQCKDECTLSGSRKCDGNGVTICGDYDGNGCLEWGTTAPCDPDQTCVSGFCQDQCKNECTVSGAKKCDGNALTTCGDANGDGCLEWGTAVPCDPGLTCSNGYCQKSCQNECTVAKATKCEGSNVVVCDDYGDGCLKWGSPSPCIPPQICSAGNCTLECTNDCDVKNAKQCVPATTNQFQVCDEIDGDGCLEWGTPQECGQGLVCDGGACVKTCSDECSPSGSTVCEGNAVRTCGDPDKDGCLEYGDPVYCKTTEECKGGKCEAKQPPAKLLISEVFYDPVVTGDTDAFVEIWGPPGTPLAGFRLVGVNGNGGADYNPIDLTKTIPEDGFFVVAHSKATGAIKAAADQFSDNADYQNGPDNIQLRYGDLVVDAVGYGSFDANDVFKGEGSPAVDVPTGHSLGRGADLADTDDNSKDFFDYATPTPGENNVKTNQKPTAKLSCPTSGTVGETLSFDASASSDPDGSIAKYEFDFGDGSAKVSGSTATATHGFAKVGSFTVSVTVTDNGGAMDSTGCVVSIGDAAAPTVKFIKPLDGKQVTQGELVAIVVDATAGPNRTIAKVEVLADGSLIGPADTTVPYEFTYTVPVTAQTGSSIALKARATDNTGSVGTSAVVNLQVKNDVPVASFTAIVTGQLKVTFDASGSSDTETPKADLKVRWDWTNDGKWDTEFSTTKVVDHTYETEGKYTAKMEVQDGAGQTASTTREFTLSSMQNVSGTVTTTTWAGTIVITGDVIVPKDNTLTILEGTSVLFTPIDQNNDGIGDYDITVNGTLKVTGTPTAPVVFSVYGNDYKKPKAFNRIKLSGSDSTISNAVVEYGDVGFDVYDNASITDSTVRYCTTGVAVNSPANATMTGVTLTDNVGNGIVVGAGTVATTRCTFQNNGKNGVYITGGTFNATEALAMANTQCGMEYLGGGAGTVTKSRITGNQYEGVRIWTDGQADPKPVFNYNNIYGNAKTGARVVDAVTCATSTTGNDYKTAVSSPWSTPGKEPIEILYVSYTESDHWSNNYESGYVRKDNGNGDILGSWTNAFTNWLKVAGQNASTIVAVVLDNSSSYSASIAVTRAAYTRAGAVREVSVIGNGKIDLRHNYFGTFPDVLKVISLGHHDDADIQGFVGVPFDATWGKGIYFGGETLTKDTTWVSDVYITGDLNVPAGKTLTIGEGARVLFVPTDQNENGEGDWALTVAGTLVANGTKNAGVTFTTNAMPKTAPGFRFVKVDGTSAVSTLAWTTFEYGNQGLILGAGTHTLGDVTVTRNQTDGFSCVNASGPVKADRLTAVANGQDGIHIQSSKNVTLDRATSTANGRTGLWLSSSNTSISFKNGTVTDNLDHGVYASQSSPVLDHCTVSGNRVGVAFVGDAKGSLSYSNIKYNKREGIQLRINETGAGGAPDPKITNNNVFGNSVVEGPKLVNPNVSVSTTGNDYKTAVSPAWTTPKGQPIQFLRVQYTENDHWSNNYESGYVRANNADGEILYSTTSQEGPVFKDISVSNVKTIVAVVLDNSSSYSATMAVPLAFYYESDLKKELSSVTDWPSTKVDCTNNYWGVFPNVQDRFTLGRADAINFDGFQITEISGNGPQ